VSDELRQAARRCQHAADWHRKGVKSTPMLAVVVADAAQLAAAWLAEQVNREHIALRCRYILGTCRGEEEMKAEARAILDLLGTRL
jgi:hypothetical protein